MTGCVMPPHSWTFLCGRHQVRSQFLFLGVTFQWGHSYRSHLPGSLLWESALVTLGSHHFLLLAVPSEGSVSETSARPETLQLITLQNSDSLEPSRRPSIVWMSVGHFAKDHTIQVPRLVDIQITSVIAYYLYIT